MSGCVQIQLAPVVNLNTISALKLQLDGAIDRNSDVILLGANVEKVDTAALQLLVAFGEKIKGQGNAISWKQPSEELCDVVALLGLESAVSLPVK